MENETTYIGITVDDTNAVLLDDAFWAENKGDTTRIQVFTPNLYANLEHALEHDLYFVKKTSLLPGREYKSICYEFCFKKDTFILCGFSIFCCSFKNIYKMSYEQLDAIFESPVKSQIKTPVFEVIELVHQMMYRFNHEKYHREDLVCTDLPQQRREIDANTMIGLLMVMVNAAVANFAVKNMIPIFFRSQLIEDRDIQKQMKKYDALLGACNGRELPDEIKIPAQRVLKQPCYVAKPKDYWGAYVPWYTHITSPARRLPDFINHANINAFIKNKKFPYSIEEIKNLQTVCNEA